MRVMRCQQPEPCGIAWAMHRDEVRILKRKKGQQRATGSQKVPRKMALYQQAISMIFLGTKTAVDANFDAIECAARFTLQDPAVTADIPALTAVNTQRKHWEIAQVCT